MMCVLPRFMMRTTYSPARILQSDCAFVPKMYYARSWTAPDIYEYFGLSDGEIQLFETAMWPMPD